MESNKPAFAVRINDYLNDKITFKEAFGTDVLADFAKGAIIEDKDADVITSISPENIYSHSIALLKGPLTPKEYLRYMAVFASLFCSEEMHHIEPDLYESISEASTLAMLTDARSDVGDIVGRMSKFIAIHALRALASTFKKAAEGMPDGPEDEKHQA